MTDKNTETEAAEDAQRPVEQLVMRDWIDVSQRPIIDWEMWQGKRRFTVHVDDYAVMAIRRGSGYFICVACVSSDGGLNDMDSDSIGYEAEDVSFWMPIPEL